MKVLQWLILASVLYASGCVTVGAGTERAVIRAKNEVAPALVHIRPVQQVFTGGRREEVPVVGSGFLITRDGYVATNEHVIGESQLVRCILYDKEEVEAVAVGVDPYTDIAVIKLSTGRSDLPAVRLGSSAKLQAGQTVLALGSPHGLSRSVSLGIVSVTDRYLGDEAGVVAPYHTWIQTDAAINPGNSGGPLVNLKGEVVGVNSLLLHGAENVGFAIPIDTARPVIDELIEYGRVRRSWIGVLLQEMLRKTEDPVQKGVVVGDVDPLSPAAEAGIRPGDVIAAVNGKPVNARFGEDLPAVRAMFASLPIGEEAEIQIRRGDETVSIPVAPRELAELRGVEAEFSEWGFTATNLTDAIVRAAQLPSRNGVVVTGTQVGSIAANARLQTSDIILTVDGVDVRDLAHFRKLYEERVNTGQSRILLEVKQGALFRYVLIKQDAAGGEVPEKESFTDEE